MTIRHLRIFVAVFDRMSITRASEALHLTQPVVTRTIKELEQHYGVALFDRINNRLRATEEGRSFYAHAMQVISAFDAMENGVRDHSEHFTVSVGSTYYLGSFVLPRVIKRFQARFPHAVIRTRVLNGENIQKAVISGELDFAVIEDMVSDSALTSEFFLRDRLALLLPSGHPLTRKEHIYMRDLRDQPFLMREDGSVNRRRQDDTFAKHGFAVTPVMESASTHAIVQCVGDGLGLTLLPEFLIADCTASGRVVHRFVSDEPFLRNHHIVWLKGKHLSAPVAETMLFCREAAQELLEEFPL